MEGFGERNEKEEMIQLKTSKCNKIFKNKRYNSLSLLSLKWFAYQGNCGLIKYIVQCYFCSYFVEKLNIGF